MTRPLALSTVTAVLLTCIAAPGLGDEAKAEKTQHLGKLRHVVLFAFKDDASEEQVKKIEDAFRALPGKIPQIVDFEWGMDCSVEGLAQDFTHCFLVTFADAKGREAYLPHPAHKEFVSLLKPHLKKVLVIDYVVKD